MSYFKIDFSCKKDPRGIWEVMWNIFGKPTLKRSHVPRSPFPKAPDKKGKTFKRGRDDDSNKRSPNSEKRIVAKEKRFANGT